MRAPSLLIVATIAFGVLAGCAAPAPMPIPTTPSFQPSAEPSRQETPKAKPSAAPTRPPTATPTITPFQFENVGNGIQVGAYYLADNIATGMTINLVITFDPVILGISRDSTGKISARSTTFWTSANVAEMQVCTAFDAPCPLTGKWVSYAARQTVPVTVDWIGTREFWVTAQFRDKADAIVQSWDTSMTTMPQDSSQVSARLNATLDERTPITALPAIVQTAVAATRTAYPVTGFVKIEEGRCCAGGKAGTPIQIQVQFGASSPLGDVKEMRVGSSQDAVSTLAWEPLIDARSYQVVPAINWTTFGLCVQYRDVQHNLSQVYCSSISIEGSP